ncbi:MAG: TonB-dependent receptor [Litorimonas sp.]
MNDTIKKHLLGSTMIAGLMAAGFAVPAHAQDADDAPIVVPDQDNDEEVGSNDEVVVTGSRIANRLGEAPIPLTVIDQDAVDLTGFNSLGDFLSDIPALQGTQVPDDTTGATNNAAGLTLLNLRNLGNQRTLVLIDGLRQTGAQSGTAAVNIETLPFISIDRTEVVTGGASSIYGADAVSGVVNFIMRNDFEGFEVDGQYAEDREGFNDSYRLGGIMGSSFGQDDRGHFVISAEYRETSELRNREVDFLERNRALLRIDNDTDVDGDGIRDADGIPNFTLIENGTLDIINNAGVLQIFAPSTVNPTGTRITFLPDGTAVAFNQGNGVDPRAGGDGPFGSNTFVNGPGTALNDLSQSLTPANKTFTTMSHVTYDLTDNIEAFADIRYSRTEADFTFQPNFFGGGTPNAIGTAAANRELNPGIFGRSFFTATDNAFLDPAAAAAIEGAFGLADVQRFQNEFNRSQDATRELFRVVGGLRGGFVSPFDESEEWGWDFNANYSRNEATNRQLNTRLNDNFFAGADAIQINQADLDQITAAGGNAGRFNVGDVVCRVQFLDEAGLPTALQAIGSISQQTIDNCVPFSIFGEGTISGEALDYVSANLNDRFNQDLLQFSANLTGDLPDLWGAGAPGFAIGAEYREESSTSAPDELALVANTFANSIQPTSGEFDVAEVYGELQLPLLTDLPLIQDLSVTGSYRYSDYSTIGNTDTYAVQGQWRPIEDLTFRGGYARAIRAPNVGELFSASSEGFAQVNDPCDIQNINQGPASRPANCAAVGVPAGYDRGTLRNISVGGTFSGNPLVNEEVSDSFFAGLTFSPDFVEGFTMAVDYFNIEIEDAIANIPVNDIFSNCVDGAAPDPNFCNLITRRADGNIETFLSGPVNIGFLRNEGIDFQAQYIRDIGDLIGSSSELGNIRLGLTGTRLLSSENQSDQNDFTTFDENRNFVGLPELRFVLNATYEYEKLALTYTLNWQNSQDVFDRRNNLFDAANNPDGRPLDDLADIPAEFLETGAFDQHDFAIRYEIFEDIQLRGGVQNIFDKDPVGFAENNIFDFFGRRYFMGFNASF